MNVGDQLLTLYIKTISGNLFEVKINSTDTVHILKENIVPHFKLPPEKQYIVFKGRQLLDDFSLSYYKILNYSHIFVAVKKSKRPNRPKASDLYNRLQKLTNELKYIFSDHVQSKKNEIIEILENPVMKAYSSFNTSYMHLCEDARDLVENEYFPISDRTRQYIAKTIDLSFVRYESSPEAIHIFQAMLEEESSSQFKDVQNTETDYQSNLSTAPLPDPWTTNKIARNLSFKKNCLINTQFSNSEICSSPSISNHKSECPPKTSSPDKMSQGIIHGDRWPDDYDDFIMRPSSYEYPTQELKEIYAPQVTQLKKMGFKDEDIIVEALAQANGNIRIAVLILQSRLQPEC